MTAYKFASHRHLRDVLNNVETVQKKDIKDFSFGHLNERNLYRQPITAQGGAVWKTSKKKRPKVKDTDLIPSIKRSQETQRSESATDKKMKDVLYEFSVGTTGSVPVIAAGHLPEAARIEKIKEFRKETSDLSYKKPSRENSAKSVYSELEDGVLVEELPNQEIMVSSPRLPPNIYAPKQFSPRDAEYDVMKDLTQMLDTDGYLTLKHTFLPTFSTGVTKQDQYSRLRQFEHSVLRKQDCKEQKILSGQKAVRHHEEQLEQDLRSMNLTGIGPNFHKLQVYSNSFEDLIDDTPTFGYTLKCIKSEYDSYITKLLDSQTPQHSRLLRDQVQQMSARGTSRPQDLKDAKQRVENLENEARKQLEENNRLRKLVEGEEEWLATAPEPGILEREFKDFKDNKITSEPPQLPVVSLYVDDTPIELADALEHEKALILEKLDALIELRRKLTQEFVPLTVCTHLEQCIKETEIEVQKLLKQNEYFERSNNEMEAELKNSIQDADTSERDARRIWKKVNSLRGLPRVNLTREEGVIEDSDDEEDDETKWNWYIS